MDSGGQAGLGGGVQPEGSGDTGHLARGQHQAQPQQGVGVEHHQPGHQDGGLQKRGKAQPDDLLAPLGEAVAVAAGDTEHIQRSHRDLDEQGAAPLEAGEKYLEYGIGHQDHTEQHHDGVEVGAIENEVYGSGGEPLRGGELGDDVLAHVADAGAQSSDARGEAGLEGDGQGVQSNGDGGEQADSHKPLEAVDGGLADVAPARGVFNAELEAGHHQADAEQRPAQLGEELYHGLHPGQVEQLHAHVAHEGEEGPKDSHDLAVHPVQDLVHDGGCDKVPNKNGKSPLFVI